MNSTLSKIQRRLTMPQIDKAQEFDNFFCDEYEYLVQFSRSIDPKTDYLDLLHDSYIRCRERITVAGYSGLDFMNFMRVTIINTYKSGYRLKQKRPQVNLECENYYQTIETKLQLKREQEQQEIDYQNQVEYLNTMVFCYIDETFDEKEQFVFKTYYLLKPKRINYSQLSNVTGLSITAVSNIIKRMKTSIKENLENYINGTITTGHTVSA